MKSLRRAAVLVAALPLSFLVTAGTASADHYVPTCPAAGSTKVVTADTPYLRLWVYQASSEETRVCFDTGVSAGVLVLRGGTLELPDVTFTPDTGRCPITLVSMTDPVALRLSVGVSADALCFDVNGVTGTITIDGGPSGLPTGVEYWRDGGLVDELVFCASELVAYLLRPEVNYEAYAECAYHPHRVL